MRNALIHWWMHNYFYLLVCQNNSLMFPPNGVSTQNTSSNSKMVKIQQKSNWDILVPQTVIPNCFFLIINTGHPAPRSCTLLVQLTQMGVAEEHYCVVLKSGQVNSHCLVSDAVFHSCLLESVAWKSLIHDRAISKLCEAQQEAQDHTSQFFAFFFF